MIIASNCEATPIVSGASGNVYLRTAAAAAYLGLGQSTLERMRIRGDGPVFRRLGAKVVAYELADLDAFASRNVLTSTTTKCAA